MSYYILLSGGFVASLPARASDLPSALSSPAINIYDYEWKCVRFWYFIGAKDARDWHTTSLIVLLRALKSDQVTLLFFADEVTDKARYIQIPLSRNSTNSKVLKNLLLLTLQVNHDYFLLLYSCTQRCRQTNVS